MHIIRFVFLLLILLSLGMVHAQEDQPAPEATADVPVITLTVWWPDQLASEDITSSLALLIAQVEAFSAENPSVDVRVRLRRVGDIGGIMSTMRTASAVAPGVLPDLTLIRRTDLVTAVRAGLIQPLEGLVPSSLLADLSGILPLGQVDGDLYGLPYTLDLLHVVYRPRTGIDYSDWDYDSFLDRELPLTLSAARSTGLTPVAYLQYLADGGGQTEAGELVFDEPALRAMLNFYENARENALITADALNYTAPSDYRSLLESGAIDSAVLRSTDYLHMRRQQSDLRIAPVPTADGIPASILDGWNWVLVTSDPDRQALAVRFLGWMMAVDQQIAMMDIVSTLPSRRTALDAYLEDDPAGLLLLALLNNANLPLIDGDAGPLGRRIQAALEAVLAGQISAEAAVEQILIEQGND